MLKAISIGLVCINPIGRIFSKDADLAYKDNVTLIL